MRRLLPLVCLVLAALVLAAPATAGTARSHTVNASVEGAVVRSGAVAVSAFLLRDNALGTGAGRLALAANGTANATAYLPGGTIKIRMKVTFGPPAGDLVPITATGSAVSGTGKFRGVTGDLELTGTQNVKELAFVTKVTGRLRY